MKLEEIREKYYKKLPKKIFTTLISLDPTTIPGKKMGRYGKWIIQSYKRGDLLEEDYYKVKEYLEVLVKYRFEKKGLDIMKFKDTTDLYHSIEDLIGKKSKRDEAKEIKSAGLEKVYDQEGWRVYKILTFEASCLIGEGTQWCTASRTSGKGNYDNYNKDGHLFVFVGPENEKFQYSIRCGVYNEKDRKIEGHDVIGKIMSSMPKTFLEIGKDVEIEIPISYDFELGSYLFDGKTMISKYLYKNYFEVGDKKPRDEHGCYYPGSYVSEYYILDSKTGEHMTENYDRYSSKISNDKKAFLFMSKKGYFVNKIMETGEIKRYEVNKKIYPNLQCSPRYSYVETMKDGSIALLDSGTMLNISAETGKLLNTYAIFLPRAEDITSFGYFYEYNRKETTLFFYDTKKKKFMEGYEPEIGQGIYNVRKLFKTKRDYNLTELRIYNGGGRFEFFKYNHVGYSRKEIKIKDGRLTSRNKCLLSNWPEDKINQFVLIHGPEWNGITSNGVRDIMITPFGWTFYKGRIIKADEEVWYKTDPYDYLGGIGVLWNLTQKKGKVGGKLAKKRLGWFDKFEEL